MSNTFGPCGEVSVIGFLPELDEDLTFPSSVTSSGYKEITGIDCSSGLTTVLSLTGKHIVSLLYLTNMTPENVTVKLTIDGVVRWDDSFSLGSTAIPLLGTNFSNNTAATDFFGCQTSFLLEVQTATDTSIDLRYMNRPIL